MAFEKATKMFSKGIAIIALTKTGVETACKISTALNKAINPITGETSERFVG